MSEIATHDPPRGADFVVGVDLADHGMPGRREQLWAEQLGPTRFCLRSLPFFPYGLRPGDEVETTEDFTVVRVVRSSGRQVLRVAAASDSDDALHRGLHPLLGQLGLAHEWHRQGYVAIDLPSRSLPSALLSYLEAQATAGVLEYEFA